MGRTQHARAKELIYLELELLLGCAVAMANDRQHAAQLLMCADSIGVVHFIFEVFHLLQQLLLIFFLRSVVRNIAGNIGVGQIVIVQHARQAGQLCKPVWLQRLHTLPCMWGMSPAEPTCRV